MNKQGKTNWLGIFVVIAVLLVGWFWLTGGVTMPDAFAPGKGKIVNGFWNEATQECWPDSSTPIDQPFSAQFDETFYQCCFNQNKQQVDCNDPGTLLGPFAIYQGQAGLFYIAHGIKVRNTGNIVLSQAWVDSAVWSPSHAELTTAYSGIVGAINGKGPLCLTTGCDEVAWSTGLIDLQVIGGAPGSPIVYTLSLMTKASATGLPDATQTIPATITVEKEQIGFSVVVNLGA
ncbi:hypothetical protein LCGC14_1055560 [marine sediment metagenome]|uniref:Uncharacterized protein n=1 Tax=marine sediment metagenome TaxID=412755 RepID=A0A0F9Q5N9_9ZZZZ